MKRMRLYSIASLAVLAFCATAPAQTLMPLPDYDRTFTGNVRGYYFQAPVDFTIVGLRVPDETGAGLQSVEVVRFGVGGPPPAFPGTTNDFDSLARFVDEPSANILAVNLPVSTGDWIGLYGQASGANSYGAPGNFASEIFGQATTLIRSGMQFTLNSGPMHDIWGETGGNVSRVELYYVPEPASLLLLGSAGLLLIRRR